MNNICFTTVVNQKYEHYIPLFWYSLYKSYPGYASTIFMKGSLSKNVRKAVAIMMDKGDFNVKENCFENFDENEQYFKTIRWLLNDDCIMDYQYLYIGDVDMIICKEPISLIEQHAQDAENQNLAYSNIVRGGQHRLIGRHFIVTKPYFKKMNPVIKKYQSLLSQGKLDPKTNDEGKGNEWVLYRMIEDSGLGFPDSNKKSDRNILSTHHGLHLGLWRTKAKDPSNDLSKDLHTSFWKQFKDMEKDGLYKNIMTHSPVDDVANMKKAYRRFFGE